MSESFATNILYLSYLQSLITVQRYGFLDYLTLLLLTTTGELERGKMTGKDDARN